MAEKIKKFFARKKADAKFKLAGPGRKLTDSSSTLVGPSKKEVPAAHRVEPSQATKAAAEAALARLNSQRKDTAFNTSLAAIQAQVRKELEAEKKSESGGSKSPPSERKSLEREIDSEQSLNLAVQGVYYRCPLFDGEVRSKDEWKVKIKEFLYDQLEEERGITACLIIRSCNYNRIKVSDGVEVLCKYLDNIIANPEETKFHKVRCSNPTFQDKVLPLLGATELLFAAGFRQERCEHKGIEEDFWVFHVENIENLLTLEFLRDALMNDDRIELVVDRNLQVLSPAQATKRIELPPDFYAISPEEVKREQQSKAEFMEKQMQLRTKAMRDKEEQREIRKYKFAIVRIRFPDGLYLQGTFSVYERFGDILEFVQEQLEVNAPFVLSAPTGHKFEETDKESTLFDLRLVPATILTFQWDPSIVEDMSVMNNTYLKTEVMMLVQSL